MIVEIKCNIVVKFCIYNIYYARIYFVCNDVTILARLHHLICFIGFPRTEDVILSL